MIRRRVYELASIAGPLARLRRRFEQLESSQYWTPSQREGHRRALLRDLLSHAAATVPFYREHWARAGCPDPADPDALVQWPIVDKSVLKSRFRDLASSAPHPTAYEYATGGSSGTPVKLLIDKEVKSWRWAAKMRNLQWAGWSPGDRIAFIWGSDFDRRRTDDLITRGFRWASNQLWLNTFNAREEDYARFASMLIRWRPAVLVGYASSLMSFHDICQSSGKTRGALGLRGIQSSAEVLHDENAQRLRDAFGCGVFDLYGQREVGNIAQNARDGGPLLVNDESVIVETIEIDGAPHIVVTDLRNRSFPLIRYDTGDVAAAAERDPRETRTLSALGKVSGRLAEMLRAPNGRLVHCEYFAHLFYSVDSVRQFQLVVGGDGRLAIRYKADGETDMTPLLDAIRRDIDPGWVVVAERVSDFQTLPSGKHCYVVREGDRP